MVFDARTQHARTSIADYLPLMGEIYASFSRLTLEEWLWINHMRGIGRELFPVETDALEALYAKYRSDIIWLGEENQNV